MISESIKYNISGMWERFSDGKACGMPLVEVNVCFPECITPDKNFLKDLGSIFQKIEKQYNERLSNQE